MYLYIESSACLHSHYFPTFRSLSVSLSAFLVFNAVHITACYHFSLYEYLRFTNVWSHFAYLSLISFTPPLPPELTYPPLHSTSSALFLFLSLSLSITSFSLSLYLPVWPICLYSLSRPMAMLVLIRTGDESSMIFAAVYPARARSSLSHRVSVCIFIKIVEYMFAIKTPGTLKKHTNEKQSSQYWYRIYNKYSVTYFF